MFGVVLLFVGAGLIHNGYDILTKTDGKPMDPRGAALVNFFTAIVLFIINWVFIIRDASYFAGGLGMLFSFTYFYIALNDWFKFDLRAFGVYCLFVSLALLPWMYQLAEVGDWWMFLLGFQWFVIFHLLWWEDTLMKMQSPSSKRKIGYLWYFGGIFSGWVPGVMMLAGWWPA